jgi:polyhydroxybutyrate depolymerase
MKTKLQLLMAELLLAAATTGWGQTTLQFSATSYTVAENAGSIALTVQRTGDTNTVAGVDYATTDLSATNGLKYTAVSGTLAFGAGETNQTIRVPILNEGFVEGTKTFRVTLSNPTNAVLGTRPIALVYITDNDKGLQLELTSYSVNEEAGAITIRVLRRDDGDFPVSVDYATTNLTAVAGQDYLDTAGTLTFAPGEVLKPVTVTLLNDAVRESSKTFRITLKNPAGGAVLGANPSATVTITDTDEVVRLPAASFTVREDAARVRFSVLRGESALAGTVDVTTANGAAIAGQDYTGVTNTLNFAAGERVKFIDVPVLNDGVKEPSETFRIVLSNPTGGAVLGSPTTVTVTILDNDPGVGFERSTNSVWEKLPGLTLNVVRGNDGWLGPFTVDYLTLDGTARAGVDYQAASGTLAFWTNEMVKSIPVLLLQNPAPATAKYFTVALNNLTGQISMGKSSSRVTIVDAAQGNVVQAQPTVRGGIAKDGSLIQVSWEGAAVLSRANSASGPWEQLGAADSPLLTVPNLPGAFYQIQSPRPARVYVPSRYDGQTALPLVLVLHGYGADAAWSLDYFRMEPLAEARGFLVCHPEGTVARDGWRFWNGTDACCDVYGSNVDDSAYLRGLIEEVARQYLVDRKRIYVTGHSSGGYMSHRMACDHADLIAGIASLAGMTFLDPNTRRPSQPVNVLQIHGTADEAVPYAGGALLAGLPVVALFPGAVTTVQTWAGFNGCQGPQWDAQPSMNLDLAVAGLDTTVLRYTNCPAGGAVELWSINGGLHAPTFFSGTTNSEYSARVIDWLLAHPKP